MYSMPFHIFYHVARADGFGPFRALYFDRTEYDDDDERPIYHA